MKSKLLFLSLLVVGVLTLVGGFYATTVQAQEKGQGNHDAIVQKLVAKFGLNEADVQAVFDEDRTARQAERQAQAEQRRAENEAKFAENLAQAVTDGTITEEQKALIISKHEEIHAQMESERQNRGTMKDMTQEERQAEMESRRAEMETRHQEMEAWASVNGIDLSWFEHMGGEGMGSKNGFGRGIGK